MDKDWLYEQYVLKDRSTQDIADEYGCVQNTVQCWLAKHGIKKNVVRHRKPKHKYEEYDYLYNASVVEHKSIASIAKENNVSYDTIHYHLQKNNIIADSLVHTKKYSKEDVDKMISLYCDDGYSANKIAGMFGTDHNTIIRALKARGIKTRGLSEAQLNILGKSFCDDLMSKEALQRLHWDEGKSCKEIGDMFGFDPGTIRRQMKRLGVKTRTNAESKIGLMIGEKHPNWKGGVTELNKLLREFFHTNLAPKIAERDGYKCQLCGKEHIPLHVHHIREFSEIVDEIINEHPDLNPDNTDDRWELYSIITADERFLDENNLITFCRDCHFYEIHNYKRKIISSQAANAEGSETIPTGSTP